MHFNLPIFKLIFLISILLNLNSRTYANSNKNFSDTAFDSVYFEIASKVAATDYKKALFLADSLNKNNTDPIRKLKSLMLISTLYQNKRELKGSIDKAIEALNIAVRIKNYVWQSRIYGALSTQYRILKIYDEGEAYLLKAIDVAKKVKISQEKIIFQGMILQEKAYYSIEKGKLHQAIKIYQEAESFFNSIENDRNRNYFLTENNEFIARTYLKLLNYSEAKKYYHLSQEYGSIPNTQDT